jgi:myotubularin-related protein 6/7/8
MPISPDGRNGWEIYNVQREYMRQGVGVRTKAWRFTDINKDYSVSEAIWVGITNLGV